jgi:hypothetical protein
LPLDDLVCPLWGVVLPHLGPSQDDVELVDDIAVERT